MPTRKQIFLFTVILTGFVLYFVVSAFRRFWEIFDSLRVPGRVERVFFETFQIGLGTGFLTCLYIMIIAMIYLYLKGYLIRLLEYAQKNNARGGEKKNQPTKNP